MHDRRTLSLAVTLLLAAGSWAASSSAAEGDEAASSGWALAIHGGAGVISRDMADERKQEYYDGLTKALAAGKEVLAGGGTALDAVERVVVILEDDALFNAGKGAVYTHEGTHELDAAIMDGRDRSCGAVTGIKTVKNPVMLARLVMEESPHVFMMGEGAETFAGVLDLERVEPSYFDTERRWESLQRALEREEETGAWHERFGTVGAAALDAHGNLAAATSTGGITNKRFGRIGDVPVMGAGTYADNASCALSGTGAGEEFIKHTVARTIAALTEYKDLTCAEAAKRVIHQRLQPGDGGVIGVGPDGGIVWEYNSGGMFRGAADSGGRFEVRIWKDE
ncbi:MAG: isoaspartyl peptidase/L-asparaginase family protein [Thermoanaerobaculia bacterium]